MAPLPTETVIDLRPPFRLDAEATVRRLQAALHELVEAIPGNIRRAPELQKALEIDAKLGWQVFRVLNTTEVSGGLDVPAPRSINRLLQAASKRNVPKPVIERTAAAYDEFEALVDHHAGDRQTFDSMLCGIAKEDCGSVDLNHRRAAFAANSHILGVQGQTRFGCHIIRAGRDARTVDILLLSGIVNLRWLRASNEPFVISRIRVGENDGAVRDQPVREPLSSNCERAGGVTVLRDFCVNLSPKLRQRELRDGYIQTEMIGDGVGNSSACTYVVGEVLRAAMDRFRTPQSPRIELAHGIRTPFELLSQDVLVEEGTFGPIVPSISTYSDLHRIADVPYQDRGADRLPLRHDVRSLGRGVDVLHTRDVPRYPELIRYALDRVGWNGERFDAYRCRVEYPILPSSVVFAFDAPNDPGAGSLEV